MIANKARTQKRLFNTKDGYQQVGKYHHENFAR